MILKSFKLYIALLIFPLAASANGLQCRDLFSKAYKTNQFVISIDGKKQSEQFLQSAHNNLIANDEPIQMKLILQQITAEGFASLEPQQIDFILKFRQNSSLLRSIFQTSEKEHLSPIKFANFVKDFGVLKDLILMKESASVEIMAEKILKKYSKLNFYNLLKDTKPASRKSVAEYFNEILDQSKVIMANRFMTVDDVHTVRKNLRDVLRFMQIEKDIIKENGELISKEKNDAIDFLKKTNMKLGEVCDHYATLILKDKQSTAEDRFTKETIVEFPESIRPRVEHFLLHYQIAVSEKVK